MKHLNILFILVLFLGSCGKEETESESRNCKKVEYNSNIEIRLADEICFPDGNSFIVSNIQHQFCPCDAICIWEGDLFVTLTTSVGTIVKDKEFYPSRIHLDRSIFNNHEITSFSYTYGSDDETVPPCAGDFDPENIVMNINLSKL